MDTRLCQVGRRVVNTDQKQSLGEPQASGHDPDGPESQPPRPDHQNKADHHPDLNEYELPELVGREPVEYFDGPSRRNDQPEPYGKPDHPDEAEEEPLHG